MITDNIAYIKNLAGRYPLLTARQETLLARQVQEAIALRAALNEDQPTPEQARILRRGGKAKEKMVCCNMRLVLHYATKHRQGNRNRHTTLELVDLFQIGCLGLQTAAEKFDPARGYKFCTYAYWWIKQAMHRIGGGIDHAIYLPCDKREVIARVLKAKSELGEDATTDEALKKAGCTREMWDDISISRMTPVYLDAPHRADSESGEYNLHESIPDTRSNADPMASKTEVRVKALREAVASIPNARTQAILMQHYGLNGEPPKTMKDIGDALGISRERIRQLKESGLNQLRFYARSYETELRYEAA